MVLGDSLAGAVGELIGMRIAEHMSHATARDDFNRPLRGCMCDCVIVCVLTLVMRINSIIKYLNVSMVVSVSQSVNNLTPHSHILKLISRFSPPYMERNNHIIRLNR